MREVPKQAALGRVVPQQRRQLRDEPGRVCGEVPLADPRVPPWPPSASTPQYGSKPSSAPSSPSPRAPKSGEKICARAGFAVRHSHSGGNAVQQLCPGPRFDKPSTCRSPLTAYAHMAYETLPTIKQTLYNFFKEAPAAQTASNQAGWQHARQDPDSKDARLGRAHLGQRLFIGRERVVSDGRSAAPGQLRALERRAEHAHVIRRGRDQPALGERDAFINSKQSRVEALCTEAQKLARRAC